MSALRKGKPAVRRGRKAYGPLYEEAAGLPNREKEDKDDAALAYAFAEHTKLISA